MLITEAFLLLGCNRKWPDLRRAALLKMCWLGSSKAHSNLVPWVRTSVGAGTLRSPHLGATLHVPVGKLHNELWTPVGGRWRSPP